MDITKATPELFAALAAAQGEIENAGKNAANPHFRSRYADLAEVLNTVRPALSKHGLSVLQGTSFDGALVSVTTVIAHASGGSATSTASCVPAKVDAQGIGACTTYLRRYALAAVVGIAQEDLDGNDAAHNTPPRAITQQRKANEMSREEIVLLCEEAGKDLGQFLQWLGAPTIAELTAEQHERGIRALKKAIATKGEAA